MRDKGWSRRIDEPRHPLRRCGEINWDPEPDFTVFDGEKMEDEVVGSKRTQTLSSVWTWFGLGIGRKMLKQVVLGTEKTEGNHNYL